MTAVNDLYREVILDHNQRPRNYKVLEAADAQAVGHNPLCGDRLVVFLRMKNGTIDEAAFQGSGCAISKASASMMTTTVRGVSAHEAHRLADQFRRMATGDKDVDPETLGKLAVFSGVSEFPARVKCATLAWHALEAALEHRAEPVSTEEATEV